MARQVQEFNLGFTRQQVWGWPIATALFMAGVGSGLFLITLWMERTGTDFGTGLILGLIIGGLATAGLFVFDLGRRERFWRVMFKPATSWLSRGVILIMALVVFGVLYVAPRWLGWLPWTDADGLGRALAVIAALAAFGVMIYSGFLLSYSPSIPFWNTPLLPILSVFYAFAGGIAALFALNLALGGAAINYKSLEVTEISLVIAVLVLILVYLLSMFYSTVAAREAVSSLLKSKLAWPFLGGVIGLGMMVPLIVTIAAYFAESGAITTSVSLMVAGILELAGGWFFRYSLLRAGILSRLM